jgi:hypothetical protein
MPQERLEFAKRFRQEYDYGSRITSPYIVKTTIFIYWKAIHSR